ncbi:MAG TPA: hypothetical protein VGL73_12970 [Caulobacteraceae bacterium]|jgi:hypothetical protein
MTVNTAFASLYGKGLLGDPLPAPETDPTQLTGLLPAPPPKPILAGVLGVPVDPGSMFAPPANPQYGVGGGPQPQGLLGLSGLNSVRPFAAQTQAPQPMSYGFGDAGPFTTFGAAGPLGFPSSQPSGNSIAGGTPMSGFTPFGIGPRKFPADSLPAAGAQVAPPSGSAKAPGTGGPPVDAPQKVAGFPHTWDSIVDADVANFNKQRGYDPGDPEYLDPDWIKAMMMTESGSDMRAYNTDPMQVNKPGDWDGYKQDLGLTKNQPPGPALSIQAGIDWLESKSYREKTGGIDGPFLGRGSHKAL